MVAPSDSVFLYISPHCVTGGVSVSLKRGAYSSVMWMIEAVGRRGVNSASSSVCVLRNAALLRDCEPEQGEGHVSGCRPKLHQLGHNTV